MLDIEEQLITGKQQLHKMTETVSATCCKSDSHNESDGKTNVVEFEVELGTTLPVGSSPVAEVKVHLVWIKQIIEATAAEIGQLEDVMKVSKNVIVYH